MAFKRGIWFPIAIAVVAINVAGGIYAYLTNEVMHGYVHGAFAVGFGIWARYLWQRRQQSERHIERADKVQMLEADLSELERELRETQERLAFADQLLRKKPPSS